MQVNILSNIDSIFWDYLSRGGEKKTMHTLAIIWLFFKCFNKSCLRNCSYKLEFGFGGGDWDVEAGGCAVALVPAIGGRNELNEASCRNTDATESLASRKYSSRDILAKG